MKKKNTLKNVLNWFKDAGLKALVILLVVATGFYAYAQITWPGSDPNPTTGVVGMFVGASETAFTTAIDYDQANQKCANHSTDVSIRGSHVCTPDEMINSYNHGVVDESPIYTHDSTAIPNLWINNGPPGFTASANDCKGWTVISRGNNDDPNFGAMWIFSKKAGGLTPCQPDKKFACCK